MMPHVVVDEPAANPSAEAVSFMMGLLRYGEMKKGPA
jgi:hypothetical protein